jgi:hypothetical protein
LLGQETHNENEINDWLDAEMYAWLNLLKGKPVRRPVPWNGKVPDALPSVPQKISFLLIPRFSALKASCSLNCMNFFLLMLTYLSGNA